MSRRVSMPAADDLFRPTAAVRAVPDAPEPAETSQEAAAPAKPSGRIRHDEKMTVYVTSDELLQIEHARLALRAGHGLAVDRGRLVREAVALVLADFDTHGADSVLVRRLTDG
ncbi:hypothetical protein [Nocardioides psychrotolerans]|uniref:hypothetical protein n=1 Tax=Nocardioides psychrotolerans TaxID=1005945 RepID=UPI0031376EB5